MFPVIRENKSRLENLLNELDNNLFKSGGLLDMGYMGLRQDDEGNKIIEVDVPGFNENNLTISKNGNMLFVTGENDKGRKIEKSMNVPVNTDNIKANVEDGVLELKFQEEENGQKKIPINSDDE